MTLSEFFQYLSFGELSQFSAGTANNGEIAIDDYPKVISYINLALTHLHTRLPLKLSQVIVRTNTRTAQYPISSAYAESVLGIDGQAPSGAKPHVIDTVNPFKDNIISIEGVVSESDYVYTLNDRSYERTVYTPSYNTLQFSEPLDELVSVMYRANHIKIPMSKKVDPLVVDLSIPDIIIEPILTYVLSKMVSNMGNAESFQEGAAYMSKVEQQIQMIEASGVIQSDIATNTRVWGDRWV